MKVLKLTTLGSSAQARLVTANDVTIEVRAGEDKTERMKAGMGALIRTSEMRESNFYPIYLVFVLRHI